MIFLQAFLVVFVLFCLWMTWRTAKSEIRKTEDNDY